VRAPAPEARILVVDDASPDGTGELADAIAARDGAVEVLHRPGKAGLGAAYIAGFAYALDAGAGLVVEMDADLSHDPEDLPRLLERAQDGADLVLGSRYVEGGGVEDWDLLRRVLSRGGCRYARTVLGVGVRDLTGGFKCFRADTLRAIDFETVRSEGYAFQVELTYRALARGLRVEEVPITFRDRSAGDSKMSARIALEAIWLVPALRIARRRDGLPEAPGSGEPGTLPIPEA
jgi:dolichol-phosphate mannosyltransferase